jgi:hypothetical protein
MRASILIFSVIFSIKFSSTYKLNCDYVERVFTQYDTGALKTYGCIGTLEKNGYDSYITEVSMNQDTGRNVTFLQYQIGQFIPKLPWHADDFYPELLVFRASRVSLEEVKAKDFKRFPKLSIVYLGQNKIREIPSNLFEFTPLLTEIILRNNHIKYVGRHFFDFLNPKSLITFAINDNTCVDAEWPLHVNIKLLQQIRDYLFIYCEPSPEMIEQEKIDRNMLRKME